MEIRFPSELSEGAFEEVLRQWTNILMGTPASYCAEESVDSYLRRVKGILDKDRIIFNLLDVRFAGLYEIAMTTILGEFTYYLTGCRVPTVLPRNILERSFMSFFGFFAHFPSWGKTDSGGSMPNDPRWKSRMMLPLKRIASSTHVGPVVHTLKTTRISTILSNVFHNEAKAASLAEIIVSELLQNIPEHSRRDVPGHGYCAIQVGKPTTPEPWRNAVEITVVDSGIGIRESVLSRYPELVRSMTTQQCIKRGFEAGWPDDGDKHRGGLILVARTIRNEFRGDMECRSVNAFIRTIGDSIISGDRSFFPGTQYRIILPYEV